MNRSKVRRIDMDTSCTAETFTLIDDGTLDTVIMCDSCGEELRFSDVERTDEGIITRAGWLSLEDAFAEHRSEETGTG